MSNVRRKQSAFAESYINAMLDAQDWIASCPTHDLARIYNVTELTRLRLHDELKQRGGKG